LPFNRSAFELQRTALLMKMQKGKVDLACQKLPIAGEKIVAIL